MYRLNHAFRTYQAFTNTVAPERENTVNNALDPKNDDEPLGI